MRRELAGIIACLAIVAAMLATMAWTVRATAPGGDPDCELSHQAVHVDTDFDLWTGKHQLSWTVINVCDRFRRMPPGDAVPLSP